MLKRKQDIPDPDEELRAAFRVFDRDDNGYITSDELRFVMCELGEKLSEGDFSDLMEIMDINGDGCIDIEGNNKEILNCLLPCIGNNLGIFCNIVYTYPLSLDQK